MRAICLKFLLILLFAMAVFPAFSQDEEDPYLWLEEVDAEKSMEWVHAQNKSTDALKNDPAFQSIYDKNLAILNSDERIAYPGIRGDYIYNFWQDDKHIRGIWRRTTMEEYRKERPTWETLLDIDALSEQDGEKWVFKGSTWLAPGYQRCIISLSRGGGDAVVNREYDAVARQFVEDGFNLPEAKGGISWVDQNTLMVATDFGEGSLTSSGYPRIVKLWKRGTPLSEAAVIFEGETSDVGIWGYAEQTPERSYQIVYRAITFFTANVYSLENGELLRLDIPEDASLKGFFKNQMIISLKTDWVVGGASYASGAMLSIDFARFLDGSRQFTIIAQPDEKSSIESVNSTKDYLLVNTLNNVRSELYRFTFKDGNWEKQKENAPDFGSIKIYDADQYSNRYFFTYNSFLIPTSLYFVSGDDGEITRLKSLPAFFDDSKYEVRQLQATSKDGTQIPYFVVHAKDIEFNGKNPTLLYGYGGFEVSMRPRYSAAVGSIWLAKGGVYAVANIRGGGEFGPKWHLAAMKENRQRSYDDFIAVAENLVEQNITSPAHLGIMGGSNGGLLVGAVFTQRPDLFNAVVCQVPLLDMRRYNKLLAGASWMGEYGNPDKPEEWAYIKKYSPYHNLSADKKYPKVYFGTSTRDDRVHPGHARKMAAKMGDMGHDVYYYENTEGGHAAATTNEQRAFGNSLVYTYLFQQLKSEVTKAKDVKL